MRRVRCYDCGKFYDFDVDDFCPRCGAFNQPKRQVRIDETGEVVRVDGINERNHRESFVHEELHAEDSRRKGTVLEAEKKKPASAPRKPVVRQPVLRPSASRPRGAAGKGNPAVIGWVILAFVLYELFMLVMFSL